MSNQNSGRVIIENVAPEVDGGRFPIVRKLGDTLVIEADMFADGHDILAAELIVTNPSKVSSIHGFISLGPGLDRFAAEIGVLDQIGTWHLQVHAWIDSFQTWIHEVDKKFEAGVSIKLELLEGQIFIQKARLSAVESGDMADSEVLDTYEIQLTDESIPLEKRVQLLKDKKLQLLMHRYALRGNVSKLDTARLLRVDRERSVCGAWYEMFPRSAAFEYGRHGDFQDLIRRLPEIADMGFDVLYLPPIHPIGTQFRKGPNNSLVAGPDDPGSPWAIGSEAGGHTAIHAQLGTLNDFHQLVEASARCDMEIALDIAFQCSPDHPWLKEHPEWFTIRPDGSIRYAENPPKKYQDIHPLNFDCNDWQGLWNALRDIFIYWIEQGVKIFRVDNPHTKPFPFWEWCLEK
jgi:starch synthase (maltosyl-transferring)